MKDVKKENCKFGLLLDIRNRMFCVGGELPFD